MKIRILIFTTLLLLTELIGFSQICKISNENDSVEVSKCELAANNTVEVTVINDSNNINVNVTVEIAVIYKNGPVSKETKYIGKGIANANGATIIKIPVSKDWENNPNYKIESVSAIGISGIKCL